ncbi:MAG: hypothetical protein ACKVP7_15900 [Hyphomicrobiaceae bacterium]
MSDAGLPLFADTATHEFVEAALIEAELFDGLPVVPPTERRLQAMLEGVSEPDRSLGFMAPLFGEVTPRALAWCAVAAGCRPAELAVLASAAMATLEDSFNLLGLMTTTGSAAVATLVHGPIVGALGMNAGVNCMGPGNRANAALGRAMALVLRNIGGARPESGDMATLGQPGKYAFCFAEPFQGPIAPLHVRRGLAARQSAVTVLGVSGTAEVLPTEERDTPEAILDPMAVSMVAAFVANGAYRQPALPEHPFVLPPELAGQMAAKGWDLQRMQAHLFARARHNGKPIAEAPSAFQPIVTGGPGVKMAHLPLWGGGSRMVTRALATL